jgi:DNA-directed RNA polymerase subunit delta
MAKSMLDVACDLLQASGKPMTFFEMVDKVAKELGMSEDEKKSKMSQFYTNLSIDGRFVVLADNCWDLRDRVPFEQVHIDMNDAYNDKIDDDDDDEELGDEEEGGEEDDDKAKELGEDVDNAAPEDNFDDEDDSTEEEKAEKAKKELGV